jgi:hypothetical protein
MLQHWPEKKLQRRIQKACQGYQIFWQCFNVSLPNSDAEEDVGLLFKQK